MTVQHRGFAAAARGFGADLETWHVESVVDAVKADQFAPTPTAAHDVLDAFAADGTPEALFALPEFGEGAVFPGEMAMGFHFVDYVVHGWDVAASLGVAYELPAEVVAAVLPLALAVPDGDFRTDGASPFARPVEPAGADDFERILRHLGRRPDWRQRFSQSASLRKRRCGNCLGTPSTRPISPHDHPAVRAVRMAARTGRGRRSGSPAPRHSEPRCGRPRFRRCCSTTAGRFPPAGRNRGRLAVPPVSPLVSAP